MELIVDANVILSAAISPEGKTCDLLFSNELTLFAPDKLSDEIKKHEEEALQKSGLPKREFDLALVLIFSRIRFVPLSDFSGFLSSAKAICPDPEDVEYLALSLKKNCPLWSNDKELKKQFGVKVISTLELIRLLSA